MTALKCEYIFKSIRERRLDPVYLFVGRDTYFAELMIQLLNDAYIKQYGAVERLRFYGADTADAFICELFNVGMFSDRKIIICKNADRLTSAQKKQLLQYVKKPDPQRIVLMTADGDHASQFGKSFETHIPVINAWTPSITQFRTFVTDYLTTRAVTIDQDALEILVTSTNDNLGHTFGELDKILAFIGDRTRITTTDVRQVVGGTKSYTIFDFSEAVAKRDLRTAVYIAKLLLAGGTEMPLFSYALYDLFFHIWAFEKIYPPERRVSKKESFEKDRHTTGHHNYAPHEMQAIFSKLLQADLKAKSTTLDSEAILIPLLCAIMPA